MKFKNISDKIKFLKLEEAWTSIKPNQVVELSNVIKEKDLEAVIEKKKDKLIKTKKVNKKPEFEEIKLKSEEELKKMKKDALNDYAASIGFEKEINTSLKKAKMIKDILKLQSK